MIGMKRIVCVIPARLKSTRFPRKILADLAGKPLIQRVFEAAKRCPHFERIVVAVDDDETKAVVEGFGGEAIMTSVDCLAGTDRLIELLKGGLIEGDIFVNWQGDGPFITPQMITDLLRGKADVWTLKQEMVDSDEIASPHNVKVVCNRRSEALYFSRSPIPYESNQYFKHIGLYAYTEEALLTIAEMDESPLEEAESLEQLRFLDYGLKIRVNETDENSLEIDTRDHLLAALTMMS